MYWQYLKYVMRHKYFVYRAGRKLGVGRWQLLKHDLSKFRPDEFIPYARYFYGGKNRHKGCYPTEHEVATLQTAYTPQYSGPTKESVKRDFDLAWLKHQHRNPHHWQWWLLRLDDGGIQALDMPNKYRREMLADWTGVGLAFGEENAPWGWYQANRHKMKLHPYTKQWVAIQMLRQEDDA